MPEPTSTPEHLGSAEHHQAPVGRVPTRAERVHAAMGKFAWIPFSSDDLIRKKQEELELEERWQRDADERKAGQ